MFDKFFKVVQYRLQHIYQHLHLCLLVYQCICSPFLLGDFHYQKGVYRLAKIFKFLLSLSFLQWFVEVLLVCDDSHLLKSLLLTDQTDFPLYWIFECFLPNNWVLFHFVLVLSFQWTIPILHGSVFYHIWPYGIHILFWCHIACSPSKNVLSRFLGSFVIFMKNTEGYQR